MKQEQEQQAGAGKRARKRNHPAPACCSCSCFIPHPSSVDLTVFRYSSGPVQLGPWRAGIFLLMTG